MDLLYSNVLFYIGFYYLTSDQYLFAMLMLLDNAMISFNTISKIYEWDKHVAFYDEPYIDRYIWYVIISFSKIILQWILYTNDYIGFILFMTIMPQPLTIILDYIAPWLSMIKHQWIKIIRHIQYAITGYLLKIFCLTALKIDPCLTRKEIAYMYKQNYRDHVLLLIKNFIILTVIKAVSDGNSLSLLLVKKLYNTKAVYQYQDPLPNIKEDLEKIKTIIIKRQFQLLFNPFVLEVMTKLYEREQIKLVVPKVSLFFNQLDLATAKMLALLSLIKLCWVVSPFILMSMISLCLSPFTLKNTLIKTIVPLMAYYFDMYYIGVIVCEYGDLLLSHIITWIIEQLSIFYKNNKHIICHDDSYNETLLYHVGYLSLIQPDYLFYMYLIVNAKHPYLTTYFIVCGRLSNYHLPHLCLLAILFYLYVNLSNYKMAPRPKIPLNMITNYAKKENKYKPIKIATPIQYSTYCHVLNSMHNPKYSIEPE